MLGYLNPWIYKNAQAWNDITTGSSEGCGIGAKGWPAAVGWDAVTGVGTATSISHCLDHPPLSLHPLPPFSRALCDGACLVPRSIPMLIGR